MDVDKIMKHMGEAQKRAEQNAPQKLPDDYICVIHPRHRVLLEKIQHSELPYEWRAPGMVNSLNGVPVFEENRAPHDKFEFMSIVTYSVKYPPIIPKEYSKAFIIWDIISTKIRRRYIIVKHWIRGFNVHKD